MTALLLATSQVKQLLVGAKDPDTLLTALPNLMDPHICISVLVTARCVCVCVCVCVSQSHAAGGCCLHPWTQRVP
jgi:hypothetical protein